MNIRGNNKKLFNLFNKMYENVHEDPEYYKEKLEGDESEKKEVLNEYVGVFSAYFGFPLVVADIEFLFGTVNMTMGYLEAITEEFLESFIYFFEEDKDKRILQ
jgi:hypothetical protein